MAGAGPPSLNKWYMNRLENGGRNHELARGRAGARPGARCGPRKKPISAALPGAWAACGSGAGGWITAEPPATRRASVPGKRPQALPSSGAPVSVCGGEHPPPLYRQPRTWRAATRGSSFHPLLPETPPLFPSNPCPFRTPAPPPPTHSRCVVRNESPEAQKEKNVCRHHACTLQVLLSITLRRRFAGGRAGEER